MRSTSSELLRKRFRVGGIVQGVGFRPYVYNLATRLRLTGFVLNDSSGVLIEVEGAPQALREFRAQLLGHPPALARIECLDEDDLPVSPTSKSFEIVSSELAGAVSTVVSADVATCRECLREMWDPSDRRFRYSFINCTNCGPRFTISRRIPYDRANTTMAPFEMCTECRAEYEDPLNRRFHAEPIACPACGPKLRLVAHTSEDLPGDPISETARLLSEGRIVAIKGLGGYHLACLAAHGNAVSTLRGRKLREEKPFALMVRDLEHAGRLAYVGSEEAALLESRAAPIVLLERRPDAPMVNEVAPDNRSLGVMLPYAPLHHLLMKELGDAIVLTSGNLSDEPIAYRDADALARLDRIADFFLTHDREIFIRCDDSVARVVRSGASFTAQPVRRSRGYAPQPISVTQPFRKPILAVGPELKHTFCLGFADRAFLSHHIGDVENWEVMESFMTGVEHYQRLFDVEPAVVAYDLHPEYLVTKWAKALDDVALIGVQHHHAHIASCLADNHRSEAVVGLALDGTGYGEDGALWGCEILLAGPAEYRRLGHLRYLPMPGGAAAIKEPWRMAAVYLDAAFGEEARGLKIDFVRRSAGRWTPILQMAARSINSPSTSSAGRLFDAAAALAGIRDRVVYEGQAAIEFEQAADPAVGYGYPCSFREGILDGVELFAALAEDLAKGTSVPFAAAAFHNGLAAGLLAGATAAASESGLTTVALSGGTFQNQLLVRKVGEGLQTAGLDVLVHRRVPPNDGGISLGQAVVANARLGEN